MKNKALAKRYAQAIFEVGEKYQLTADIGGQLNLFWAELGKNSDFRRLILGRSMQRFQKKQIIENVFGKSFHNLTLNFLYVVLDKNRETVLADIIENYHELCRHKEGKIIAKLISAKPVDDTTMEKLGQALKSAHYYNEIVFEKEVDSSLLGGAILKIGDLMLDGSLKSRLRHMREGLIKN